MSGSSMQSGGATQWRHPCTCGEKVAQQRRVAPWVRMHSQVSRANLEYFVPEDRVEDGVSEDDLRELLDEAQEMGGSLIACNVCGTVKIVDIDNV